MRQFWLRPAIYRYGSPIDFVKDFRLRPEDRIIADRAVFNSYFGELLPGANVFFVEDHGTGKSDFETAAAIRDATGPSDGRTGRVVAIGDDTAVEMGKIASLENAGPLPDLFAGRLPVRRTRELILAPATCGAGGEATNVVMLRPGAGEDRLLLKSDALFADGAVLIPQLLEGLPFASFAVGAVDALIRAAESFVSPIASSHTRLFARTAMEKILRGFRDIVVNGEMARIPLLGEFMTAANYAGIAFANTGGGAVHALAAPLVGSRDVPPGEANRAFFLKVFERYRENGESSEVACFDRVLAMALGCEEKNVGAELASLIDRMLPRKTLCDYGVTDADLDRFAAGVMTRQGRFMANSPAVLDADDILSIYKSLFRRLPVPAETW